MTEEMAGGQHQNDEATQGPSVRVNTRTTKIGDLKFNTRVCLQAANTPEKNSLATADLVRESPFPRTLGSEAAANTVQFNERIVIPSAKDEVGTDLEGIRVY